MARIVFIGAGSVVFTRNLVGDIITFDELGGSELVLMDVDEHRLDRITRLVRRVVDQEGASLGVSSTTSRREALRGADYVIVTIAVGGVDAFREDIGIPARYGVGQAIGDTLGPGGIFRGLRHLAVMDGLVEDMGELCPDAMVLQYSNPMAIVTWRLLHSPLQVVGLCHSVQGTSAQLARWCGYEPEDVDYWVAGVNHQAWFLELKAKGKGGRDLLPVLRERLSTGELDGEDPVRIELFRRFGYFVTESSAHASEYYPYFRKNEKMVGEWAARYVPPESQWYGGKTGGCVQQVEERAGAYEQMVEAQVSGAERFTVRRSEEYGARIIAASETGSLLRINGNVRNDGLVTNLPAGCCVEVPCLVDGNGIHPCVVGDLPTPLAALNRASISVQELVVEGHVRKDRSLIYDALALDPLTASVCTLADIHRMADELFDANEKWITI